MCVAIANNGKEAFEAIAETAYDIVLMDVSMPVMGGYEATRLLRLDKKYTDLPIIAMTAHAMQGAKEECLQAGMNDYVSKPIDPDQLFSVLAKWVKTSIRPLRPKPQVSEGDLPESLPEIDKMIVAFDHDLQLVLHQLASGSYDGWRTHRARR